ncbi:MAG: RidA family protein [Alphaproteobacteria bacterium]|nr:RidA family protein [Alphaproteobacteria bacterium]
MPDFDNPSSVHAPAGLYSHAATVKAGAEMLFISGQIGMRPDGSTPSGAAEQADQVFANIIAILDAHGMGARNIVKLTTFMVAGVDGDAVRAARRKHLGDHRPASTAVYIPALVSPDYLVEVEAVAARD